MDGHIPPKDVAQTARRAVQWIEDGRAGAGFTSTGEHRAHELAERREVPDEHITKMKHYFARHRHDADAEGFQHGQDGYPSAGRVAWDAWGGNPGWHWVSQQQFEDL